MMKKHILALAAFSAVAASGSAMAQSSVTLYGIADVWFGSLKTGGVRQTLLDSGGISGSRYGFKGSEDLGGGLKANFLLENGFDLSRGAGATGQAFSRQSYVGFSGGFGEVKLGKVWTPFDDINGNTRAAFDSAFSPDNGVWNSNNYNANPANTIYYSAPAFGPVSAAVSYSLGENKTATSSAGNVISTNVTYAGGPLYAGLALQREKAGGGAVSTTFTRLQASYDLGVAKLLGGYGRVKTGGARTTEWQLGADVPVSTALTLSGGYASSKDNAAAGSAKRSGLGFAGMYSMSKRTSLYAGFQRNSVKGASEKNTLLATGIKHTF